MTDRYKSMIDPFEKEWHADNRDGGLIKTDLISVDPLNPCHPHAIKLLRNKEAQSPYRNVYKIHRICLNSIPCLPIFGTYQTNCT